MCKYSDHESLCDDKAIALTYKELTEKLKEIEGKFTDVYDAINYLLNKDKMQIDQGQRKRIGFKPEQ